LMLLHYLSMLEVLNLNSYDFPIRGLDAYKNNRPILNNHEIESLKSGKNSTKIISNGFYRNKVFEVLENQAVGRLHNKLAKTIFQGAGGKLYDEGFKGTLGGKEYILIKQFYYEISKTPPEFTPEALKDHFEREKISKYLRLKNNIVYYPIPIMIYAFEDVMGSKVKFIFSRDLIGGEPAPEMGLPGGRDVDYIVVLEREPSIEDIFFSKWVEAYLDNLVGSAIINFMLKEALLAGQKVEDFFYKPYNEIINHNIIEIHLMSFDDALNYVDISNKPKDGYELLINYMGDTLYGKAKAPDIKLYDITKYKMRIDAAKEAVLESMGIPIDESKTYEEFERRVNAAVLEKKIKFNIIKIEE